MAPRVQYVTTPDGVSIAYCEMGQGYPVIHMPGPPFTHVQSEMAMPSYSNNNLRLAERFRGIRVVRQLVAGNGFLFNDRGEHALKGFEDPARVWEVAWREAG